LNLKYLTYHEIDKEKWDHCIKHAANRLIYAESTYLDMMTGCKWDAIIMNDYEALMPLIYKRKFGISYLYQPAFVQQSGIFSIKNMGAQQINSFVEMAATHFKFGEITLNYQNELTGKQSNFIQSKRNNFIININRSYQLIREDYSIYIRQRLKRLEKYQLKYIECGTIEEVLKNYQKLYGEKMKGVKPKDYTFFKKLCEVYNKENGLIIRSVYNKDGDKLLASVLLFRDERRIYNIVSCIYPDGKKLLANYFLYDQIIREFSGAGLMFDFEGSDVPGIAFFYKKFAQQNQPYTFIKWNKLPKAIQLIKK
jgi:hypothetical protein